MRRRPKVMPYYPVFLDLRGQPCVVVGGGRVAERKVRSLLRAGAAVHVVSPDLTPRLALLAAKKQITLTPRAYSQGDLKRGPQGPAARGPGPRDFPPLLVFAATNNPQAQAQVREGARALGALVNIADNREQSTFLVPATFRQGDLQVAISTSGTSPALARWLRKQLRATLGSEYRTYIRFLRAARGRIQKSIPIQQERAKLLRQLTGRVVLD